MSAIFGYINLDGQPADPAIARKMQDAMDHWAADDSGLVVMGGLALGHLMLWNTPGSKMDKQPYSDTGKDLCITADVRLDNRDELINQLGIGSRNIPDCRLILLAWQKWRTNCPKYLIGDFAFAIWDGREKQLFCAGDHLGVKPFYYYHRGNLFVFASEIKGLLAHPLVDASLNELWIADLLCRFTIDASSTLYRHIKRISPAQHLQFQAGKAPSIEQYWELSPDQELPPATDEAYISGFREKLTTAVECRLQTDYQVGAELSGGLDSTGVTAIAHRLLKEQQRSLQAYSLVLPVGADLYMPDEREAIEAFCRYAGIEAPCYITGEEGGLLQALEWNARIQDEPPREMNVAYRDLLFQQAQQADIRVLLSGFGGDDLVSSHAAGYQEDLMKQGRWLTCWREVRAQKKRRSTGYHPIVRMGSLITGRILGMLGIDYYELMDRRMSAKYPMGKLKLQQRPILPDWKQQFDMEQRQLLFKEVYSRLPELRASQVKRLMQPHSQLRMGYCDLATRSFRMEYRYPLLDIRLLEYYLALPTRMKAQNGYGRYIYRMSLEGLLPPSLQWREDKTGSAQPHVAQREEIDADQLFALLWSIPKDHKIYQYADLSRLKPKQDIQLKGMTKVWRQLDPAFQCLILDRKLNPS